MTAKNDNQQLPRSSQQTKELKRKLTWRLLLDWLIYTVLFALIAFLLNITLVPRIADDIADSTSQWNYWYLKDYSLEVCLSTLNGKIYYATDSKENLDEIGTVINEFYGFPVNNAATDDYAGTNNDPSGGELSGVVSGDTGSSRAGFSEAEAKEKTADGENMAIAVMSSDSNSSYEFDMSIYDKSLEFLEASPNLPTGEDVDKNIDNLVLYVSLSDASPQWCTLEYLQELTIISQNSIIRNGLSNWQSIRTPDGFAARDLTIYNVVKQLKYPLAAALYLIGCVVVFFVGYGRALKYFNELFTAVGKMMVDREKPIKLSKKLATTQNELNAIRLASLADERAAQAAERRKDELVAYLAHDIRTPLTSVIGYLSLLDEAEDMDTETRKRYIRIAFDKSQRLETLIDEFFEITRYNLQAIPIERENVDVSLLCEQVAEEFYPDAEARGIHIKIDAPEKGMIFVDPNKIARVIGNVLRNAVAYADPDTDIIVQARLKDGAAEADSSDDTGASSGDVSLSDGQLNRAKHAVRAYGKDQKWVITITNSGREISEVHLQKIFEKFFREDSSRGSSSGRSGLGLAIAKEIIVAHNGQIEASSSNGVTVFTITLPAG